MTVPRVSRALGRVALLALAAIVLGTVWNRLYFDHGLLPKGPDLLRAVLWYDGERSYDLAWADQVILSAVAVVPLYVGIRTTRSRR